MIPHWHYLYRRFLGFLPIQFCMVCSKPYWAGFPGCWNRHAWRFDWMPSMSDYCSRACCDEDLEMCAAMHPEITRHVEDNQPDNRSNEIG